MAEAGLKGPLYSSIPANKLRLIKDGTEIYDNETLESRDICDQCKITYIETIEIKD